MMNHATRWMHGGIWSWPMLCLLGLVLLVVVVCQWLKK